VGWDSNPSWQSDPLRASGPRWQDDPAAGSGSQWQSSLPPDSDPGWQEGLRPDSDPLPADVPPLPDDLADHPGLAGRSGVYGRPRPAAPPADPAGRKRDNGSR
jgi:hypothetical protein